MVVSLETIYMYIYTNNKTDLAGCIYIFVHIHAYIYKYVCVCVCVAVTIKKMRHEATDFEMGAYGKGWRWLLGGAKGKKGKKETDVILFQLKTYVFLKRKSL